MIKIIIEEQKKFPEFSIFFRDKNFIETLCGIYNSQLIEKWLYIYEKEKKIELSLHTLITKEKKIKLLQVEEKFLNFNSQEDIQLYLK